MQAFVDVTASDVIDAFAADCRAAGIDPREVLSAVGFHRSTWFRWKEKKVSPNLEGFLKARAKLSEMRAERSRHAGEMSEARL